ncbi:sugar phosphate nucleotidyltransferase [Paenibacillus sp. NPDC058174]|uniref:sugar phosphate nucleotidyltransferase n=1 Tax=Paenibacillus sp. NPDC058174 TaxID=3346366 RepID=UPI0036D93769
MKLVLLSGGSGKRLWPLSNDARSKQFLKVLEDEDQRRVSMVQRVWGQLEQSGLAESSLIATSQSQVEMMHSQLGEQVPLIIEPERRDTFAAIALSAVYLYSQKGASLDEVAIVLPVDPYVETRFFDTVKDLEATLHASQAEMALIGIQPTYASSKYGYIVPSSKPDASVQPIYRTVERFVEKPDEEKAQALMSQNALWNSGVFAFRIGYMTDLLERKGFPIQYEELAKQYHLLPKISFDYEVIERMDNIVVIPYDGYWKDLGTWNTLTEEMNSNQLGRGMVSPDSINTHLINETDMPVSIIGVSNVVVAVSPDGILVTDKQASPRVKDFIDYDQEPMFEERQWGYSRVLDYQKYEDGSCVVTKRALIRQNRSFGYQLNVHREESWTVIRGTGEFVLNGRFMSVKAGSTLHIPMQSLHSIRAITELEIIVIQTGRDADHNQVMELYRTWDEVAEHAIYKR